MQWILCDCPILVTSKPKINIFLKKNSSLHRPISGTLYSKSFQKTLILPFKNSMSSRDQVMSVISVPCPDSISRLVLPKIAKKCQKYQLNSQNLAIFVKSTSGSTEIHDFWFLAILGNFFCATIWLFTKITKSSIFDWRFWAIFGKTTSGNTMRTGHRNDGGTFISDVFPKLHFLKDFSLPLLWHVLGLTRLWPR